jgi:hypothetical protein
LIAGGNQPLRETEAKRDQLLAAAIAPVVEADRGLIFRCGSEFVAIEARCF